MPTIQIRKTTEQLSGERYALIERSIYFNDKGFPRGKDGLSFSSITYDIDFGYWDLSHIRLDGELQNFEVSIRRDNYVRDNETLASADHYLQNDVGEMGRERLWWIAEKLAPEPVSPWYIAEFLNTQGYEHEETADSLVERYREWASDNGTVQYFKDDHPVQGYRDYENNRVASGFGNGWYTMDEWAGIMYRNSLPASNYT